MRIVEMCSCGATIEVADQSFVTKDRYGLELVATARSKPPWEVVSEWRANHVCRRPGEQEEAA